MKHRLLLAGLLILSGFFSFGQKPIVFPAPPAALCVESPVALLFTSTLAFQPGNTFRLQIRRSSDFSGAVLREIPVTASGNALAVTFPELRSQ